MVRSRVLRGVANWLQRHAAVDRHSITLTIAPAQAERTFQIDLPRWSLRLLGAILVASFVLVLVGGVLYGRLIRDAVVLREVRQENEVLRARAARLEELEKDVAQLDRVRRQLYELAGVPDAAAGSIDEMGNASEAADSGMNAESAATAAPVEGAADEVLAAGAAGSTGDAGSEGSPADADSPLHTLPLRGPISRGFSVGTERNPEHAGIDIAGREGTDVVAAANGMVEFAGQDETFGNMLILRHPNGWETKYGHNKALLVARGDSVLAGQPIALLGSTGKSSAPHLHFEVHHDGTAVDPGTLFPAYRTRF